MLSFDIPIIPTAQQRARHTRAGRTYKSATQCANERTLEAMLLPYRPETPLEGGLSLKFEAFMPIPLSASKKRAEAMLDGKIGHTHKPDIDNLCKQILDSMTRLRFWEDDRQIVELAARKRYDRTPRWHIELSAV